MIRNLIQWSIKIKNFIRTQIHRWATTHSRLRLDSFLRMTPCTHTRTRKHIYTHTHTHRHRQRNRFDHSCQTMTHKSSQHTATCCNMLQHAAALQHTLQHTQIKIEYNHSCQTMTQRSLQHAATRCNTLQHAATRCNTLIHAATRCNTLQHAATRCSTCTHTDLLWPQLSLHDSLSPYDS